MYKELKKNFRVMVFLLVLFGCKSITGPTAPEVIFVSAGSHPSELCVNSVTNKIYVSNYYSDNVTVIDGETNDTNTVAAGDSPRAICVNTTTNKIYVANVDSDNVTVIDGATNSTTTVAAGDGPVAIGVNQATNKIYVANSWSNNVAVLYYQ